MSAIVNSGHDTRFKTGSILLLVSAALMALNHFVLIFALDEPTLFTGYAAFNFYSLVVLYIPFRRHERWAWYVTWILPLGLAAPAFTDPNLAIFYYSVAAACVVGLLLTMHDFFAKG
jgi:hypothetical protein